MSTPASIKRAIHERRLHCLSHVPDAGYMVCATFDTLGEFNEFATRVLELRGNFTSVLWERNDDPSRYRYGGAIAWFEDATTYLVEFKLRWDVSIEELIEHVQSPSRPVR